MSDPKSTRYTLTPEQRRILAEARERERKTRQEYDRLQQHKDEIATIKDDLESAAKSVDMLVERIGAEKEEQTYIRDSLVQIQAVLQDASAMDIQNGLEKLQSINSKMHITCYRMKMWLVWKLMSRYSKNMYVQVHSELLAIYLRCCLLNM